MKKFNVRTDIAGSDLVAVCARRGMEAYVDSHLDARYPNYRYVEQVRRGHVVTAGLVLASEAPERVIELMRQL